MIFFIISPALVWGTEIDLWSQKSNFIRSNMHINRHGYGQGKIYINIDLIFFLLCKMLIGWRNNLMISISIYIYRYYCHYFNGYEVFDSATITITDDITNDTNNKINDFDNIMQTQSKLLCADVIPQTDLARSTPLNIIIICCCCCFCWCN